MRKQVFRIESDGFNGAWYPASVQSYRGLIIMLGDSSEDRMAKTGAKWLNEQGIHVMAMSPDKKDYGHHNYSLERFGKTVQNRAVELGITTEEEINKRSLLFKAVCIPGYMVYLLVCVYALNGARGFWPGFWQAFVILSVMNLIDRFLIDEYWVGYTNAWIIPGTEDLRPYITAQDKQRKWIMGTVGMAVIAAALSGIMCLIL